MKTTTLRLRRVRFKGGRSLTVMRSFERDSKARKADCRRIVENVLEAQGDQFAGFAFVVWGHDMSSTADMRSAGGIPSIYVPDFARNRLLAKKIEEWTIDEIS